MQFTKEELYHNSSVSATELSTSGLTFVLLYISMSARNSCHASQGYHYDHTPLMRCDCIDELRLSRQFRRDALAGKQALGFGDAPWNGGNAAKHNPRGPADLPIHVETDSATHYSVSPRLA